MKSVEMHRPLEGGQLGRSLGAIVGGAAVVAATWNRGLGPHWYPVALIALAMPQAWAGGRLRLVQQGGGE